MSSPPSRPHASGTRSPQRSRSPHRARKKEPPNEMTHLISNSNHSPHKHKHKKKSKKAAARLEDDVPFYSRPLQRKRWEEDGGELPWESPNENLSDISHWGDMFWNIFFVSGAYNLADSFQKSPNGIGFLYFVACFFALVRLWYDKCTFDERFVIPDNLSYRIVQLIHYCLLGTAVQHIRPAQQMSHTTEYPTMLIYCVTLLGTHILHFNQDLDLLMNVEGGLEASVNARNDMIQRVIPFMCLSLALLLSARDYAGARNHHGKEGEETETFLGAVNHWPIILVLVAFLAAQVSSFYVYAVVSDDTRSQSLVPMNLEHVIHRMREWVTLMLGAAVLGLLVAQQFDDEIHYYFTFYCGIVTISLFQYLYFRSAPFDPEDHALKRSSVGAASFFYGMVFYSASLILVGCSFKMILHYYHQKEKQHQQGQRTVQTMPQELLEQRQAIANLYCWSAAASFVALDCILLSHRGLVANLKCLRTREGKVAWKPTLLACTDYAMTIVLATLSQWIHDLEIITVVGLVCISTQVLLRTRGLRYFPVSKQSMDQLIGETSTAEVITR